MFILKRDSFCRPNDPYGTKKDLGDITAAGNRIVHGFLKLYSITVYNGSAFTILP